MSVKAINKNMDGVTKVFTDAVWEMISKNPLCPWVKVGTKEKIEVPEEVSDETQKKTIEQLKKEIESLKGAKAVEESKDIPDSMPEVMKVGMWEIPDSMKGLRKMLNTLEVKLPKNPSKKDLQELLRKKLEDDNRKSKE